MDLKLQPALMKVVFSLVLGWVLSVQVSICRAELIYGITANRLIHFDSATPGTIFGSVALSGVSGSLIGIDFRPANGKLYGLGNNGGVGTIYSINLATGAATTVYFLTTALTGTSFGVDFNPVADALRIVSNSGQNLRIAGFPTNIFTTHFETALSLTGVSGVAYSNNVANATSTTLYDIRSTDSAL